MCHLAAVLATGSGRDADNGVVGLLGLRGIDGEVMELPLELARTRLHEIEVTVEVYIDVAAKELGSNFKEIAEPVTVG
jgi:hypothetical protein